MLRSIPNFGVSRIFRKNDPAPRVRSERRRLPFPAYFVRAPREGGYSDSVSISVVQVVRLDRATSQATVQIRYGSVLETKCVPFDALATSTTRAHELADHFLTALASRAALTNVPVVTGANADTLNEVHA
jgi:hypothetical protein